MKSWILLAFLMAATPAHAIPSFLNNILLLADSPPQITTAYLDKTKYQLGDQMLITAGIKDDWATKKVQAQIENEKGHETIELTQITGNDQKGTWQGAWKVHDTKGEKSYKTKIIATDVSGQKTEKILVWTDPTQGHPLSEITIDQDLNMNNKNIYRTNSIKGVQLLVGYWTKYDANNDNVIDKNEFTLALNDYLYNKVISKYQFLEVLDKYNHDVAANYDANADGIIQKSEVTNALNDYLFGTNKITKEAATFVVAKYQSDLEGSVAAWDRNKDARIDKTEFIFALNCYLFPNAPCTDPNTPITKDVMTAVLAKYQSDLGGYVVDWDKNRDGIINQTEVTLMVDSYFNTNGVTPTKDVMTAVLTKYYDDVKGIVMEYAGPDGIVERNEAATAINDYLLDHKISKDIESAVIDQYYRDAIVIRPSGSNDNYIDSNVEINGCLKYNGGTLGTCK